MVRADLAVATTPAMPEAAAHAVGKATAHAMADIVPEFMVLASVASVIRRIPVTIGHISVTRQGAAIAKAAFHVTRRTAVFVGIGLRSSRLRSNERSRGQTDAARQQDRFHGKFAAVHRRPPRSIAPSIV